MLDTYLTFGYMIGEETLFAGVRRLPPGHALIAENGIDAPARILDVRQRPHRRGSARAITRAKTPLIEDARRLIAESVRLHLRSDVPLGLFLSGGVNSAAVLALMVARKREGRIKTFTVGYDMPSAG